MRLTVLLFALPFPALAQDGLYDSADPTLPDWLKTHNYLPAPAAQAVDRPLKITNAGRSPLRCEVTLAHWYVIHPDPIPAGGQITLPLRFEPQSETVSMQNAAGVEMAVEGLGCGRDGPSFRLDFRQLAREGAAGTQLTCDAAQGCRTDGAK